jgi:hypothetical protein
MRTVSVPTFRNETDVVELGAIAARQTLREFQREGTFAIRRTGKTSVLPLAERHDMMPYFSLSLMVFYYLARKREKDILIAEKIADKNGNLQIPIPDNWHADEQTKTPTSDRISERFIKISFPVSSQAELDLMIENEKRV